jgi:hypothetical protein
VPRRPPGAQRLHTLSLLTLTAHGVTARPLATGIHDGGAALSGDGTTVAAAIPATAGAAPSELCAFDLRTGARTACVGGLPVQRAEGHLTSDATGRHVYVTWLPVPTAVPTSPAEFTVRVAEWSTGTHVVRDTGWRVPLAWAYVQPAPTGVVLSTAGAVGLVLPRPGAAAPTARLTPTAPSAPPSPTAACPRHRPPPSRRARSPPIRAADLNDRRPPARWRAGASVRAPGGGLRGWGRRRRPGGGSPGW